MNCILPSLVCIQHWSVPEQHISWQLLSFRTKAGALENVFVSLRKATRLCYSKHSGRCCIMLWQFPLWHFMSNFLLLKAFGYPNLNRGINCFQEMFWNLCLWCCFKCANLMDIIFVWWWQVIVNMSRIQWRGLALNLPIKLKDFNKMLSINAAVREMLHSHPKIYLENENPHCNVSQVGPASFELAITCDLKPMVTRCQLRIPLFKAPQTMQ